jgi:flagellar protein FlaG
MILFIASIIVAASVVGVFTDSINQVSDAIDQRGLAVSENVRTDVQIISDSGSDAVYDDGTGNITIHVKNTGTETLPARADRIDLFVDGEYETDFNVTLLDGAETWGTGEVVMMEIEPNDGSGLNAGDHRVKLVINEDEEVFEFRT